MINTDNTREEPIISSSNHQHDAIQTNSNTTIKVSLPFKTRCSKFLQLWNNYQWRMRHYFYIHLAVFFSNALIFGAIIWAIEGHAIPFIDCWFLSATCVFTCGLQTYEFGAFSRASQIILLFVTLISGITVSTIPAIFIKIYQAKRKSNNIEKTSARPTNENDTLPTKQLTDQVLLDPFLRRRLQSLPDPHHLRLIAYIILIVLILSTCFFIYLFSFITMGFWLKYHYNLQHYTQTNATVNPFYAALVISITAFNQNGLTAWKNDANVFVGDIFMNIVIMIVVASGTSLFPAVLRGIIDMFKQVVPWRYKIFFDYILLNNHRLSAVIFPSIQTRLYVTSTILMQIFGVSIALILDYHNPALAMHSGVQRFVIFMFLTVNTRFAGYTTIDLSQLASATLIIFVLLMYVKPQMLCTIDETPFEMEWIMLQTQRDSENLGQNNDRRDSVKIFLPFDRMKHYLLRQGSRTKAQLGRYFAELLQVDETEAAINQFAEQHRHRLSLVSSRSINSFEEFNYTISSNRQISFLRMKLLLIIFCRHAILSLFSLLVSTRTWLFIAVFFICAFETSYLVPNRPTTTVLSIIFEVVSAFGGCGLSMGYLSKFSGLASVFSVPCKIILILLMCMGRHRGLLDSMKDQEEIEYSAQTLIDSWRQLIIFEYQQKTKTNIRKKTRRKPTNIITPTPPISTRF